MTIFRLRTLICHFASPRTPNIEGLRSKHWSSWNWALVTLAGTLAIAGIVGYTLSLGIDGAGLRAALTSRGILGGAGFGRALK